MSFSYSVKELVEMAIGLELNGEAFYRALADKADRKDIIAIYNGLAIEEKKHLNSFQRLLKSLGEYKSPEANNEEYMLYLKALGENTVFSTAPEAQQRAATLSSQIEALNIGIQAEKDSILFFQGMRDFLQPTDHRFVLAIIREEQAHLKQLSDLKATIEKKSKKP